MNEAQWDREVDVLVIGSGAGGMAAALSAQAAGCSVLLVEKTDRIGGSTAISGGAVWAPLNSQSAKVGHPDTFEQAWIYMQNTVGDAASPDMQKTFLKACGPAIDALQSHGLLELTARSHSPDYYPDRDGAAMGGRSLDPLAFDGRLLGRRAFRELRDPLPEFTVLGGMMVTLTDAKNLLAIRQSIDSFKAGCKLITRYAMDRLMGYHRGTRLVLGNALAARLFKSLLDRHIDYWLQSRVTRLLQDNGRVCGAQVAREGNQTLHIGARKAVVVATGGFPWNESMRAKLYPQPTGPWSMSPQGNTGDGIGLAKCAGAATGTGGAAFWAPVSLLQRPDGSIVRFPHLVWDRAKPGLMAVNSAGRRFVNESTSYHEFVRAMYRANQDAPSVPSYLICDSDFMERWGLGMALPGGRSREHLVRSGYLHRADSFPALAQGLNIDGVALAESARRFDACADTGVDPEFGKGSTAYNRYLGDPDHKPNPCLGPLRKAPFYAVKVYAGDIGTACGIRCNEHAQALDEYGTPVPGLYVVGNDMHSVMGGEYPAPGITLGPALTFGWLAGQHAAASINPEMSS